MDVLHDIDTGLFLVEADEEERKLKPDYLRFLPRYLSAFGTLALRARRRDEAQFVMALLGVRGMQPVGWEPYETTIKGIQAVTQLHNDTDDRLAARHLQLWIYGHIVEAAVPYDLLANLIQIGNGNTARMTWFPDQGPRPVSPATKIRKIAAWADEVGNEAAGPLLRQLLDRDLRNAIFHSDYSIHGAEIILSGGGGVRTLEELAVITGRADAYHNAVVGVRGGSLRSYTEPKRIPGGQICPGEDLMIIVREAEGAIGLKDALTPAERSSGGIPFRYALLLPGEREMLDADPELALLPAREPPQTRS